MLPGWKTWEEIDVCNTLEYDVKSNQVKNIVVKCTKVQLKGLKINRPHKLFWYIQQVFDAIFFLNNKRSRKRFQIWIGNIYVLELK